MFEISSRASPITVSVKINNCPLSMELDTGAAVSVISESTFHSLLGKSIELQPSTTTLHTYLENFLYSEQLKLKFSTNHNKQLCQFLSSKEKAQVCLVAID